MARHGQQIASMEAQVISSSDSRYPDSLRKVFGALASPDIWYLGNDELLEKDGVGFCGSRNATENGVAVAADCARQLSEQGVLVVSGYAPGVDMASHEAALASGGTTIVVLAEGIDHFRVKKSIREVWDWTRVLVISYFPKTAIWRADRAMDRNKAIVAISKAVIVIEARDKGGTLNAGYCALEMRRPLFVALYDEMNGAREGNERLIRDGGIPLQRSRATRQASLTKVLAAVSDASKFSP